VGSHLKITASCYDTKPYLQGKSEFPYEEYVHRIDGRYMVEAAGLDANFVQTDKKATI